MYHGVILEKEPLNEVSVKNVNSIQFEKQLNYLRKRFNLLTLSEAVQNIKKEILPLKSAVLTFDDGYENNYTNVFPALKKHGIKATIFLTGATDSQNLNWNDKIEIQIFNTDKKEILVNNERYKLECERNKIDAIVKLKSIGNKLKYSDLQIFSKNITEQLGEIKQFSNYKILNWEQIREMRNYGIELGAHSLSHPGLSAQTEEILNEEIGEIKTLMEENIRIKATSFSYPTGLYNDECIKIVKEQNYECAVTSNYGFNKKINFYELERIAVGKHMTFPLFVLNLIIPLHKINEFIIKIYHKVFKQNSKNISEVK